MSDRIVGSVALAGPARRAMFRGVTASEVVSLTQSPEAARLDVGVSRLSSSQRAHAY